MNQPENIHSKTAAYKVLLQANHKNWLDKKMTWPIDAPVVTPSTLQK